jgi:hypothetical protein
VRRRLTTRSWMILVIVSALLAAAERGWRRHELASWAYNAQDWAYFYAGQERRETNSSIRSDYRKWKRAMEHYARHPTERLWYQPSLPWWPASPRQAFVGPGGAP